MLSINAGGKSFTPLKEALNTHYDSLFASLPQVGFYACMDYQYIPNEIPFYPPLNSTSALDNATILGAQYRLSTDNFYSHDANATKTPGNDARQGTSEQRYEKLASIMKLLNDAMNDEASATLKEKWLMMKLMLRLIAASDLLFCPQKEGTDRSRRQQEAAQRKGDKHLPYSVTTRHSDFYMDLLILRHDTGFRTKGGKGGNPATKHLYSWAQDGPRAAS